MVIPQHSSIIWKGIPFTYSEAERKYLHKIVRAKVAFTLGGLGT